MTTSRRSIVLALACALIVPLWAVVSAGLVQVRACVPQVGMLTDAHLLFLRPAADCPSGAALDESGVLAVVGTIAVSTLLVHLAGIGALAGVGSVVARAAALVARLLDHVLPGRRTPGGAVAVVRRAAVSGATAFSGAVRGAVTSVVGLRAPPVAA